MRDVNKGKWMDEVTLSTCRMEQHKQPTATYLKSDNINKHNKETKRKCNIENLILQSEIEKSAKIVICNWKWKAYISNTLPTS